DPLVRTDGQLPEASAHVEMLRVVGLAGPGGLEVVDAAARVVFGEALANAAREGKVLGELRQRSELDRIRLNLAPDDRTPVRHFPKHPEVRRRHLYPGVGPQRQPSPRHLEAPALALARTQPPSEVVQLDDRGVPRDANR